MKPVDFPESNVTLVADDCNDLPAFQDSDGYITCWELSGDELYQILQSKRVWLHVLTDKHPPIILNASYPFVLDDEPENEKEKEDGEGYTPA